MRELDFSLAPGERLALVGENGAGKTTLVKLLARLYDPTEGRILLDGVDLREYDLDEPAAERRRDLPGLRALRLRARGEHRRRQDRARAEDEPRIEGRPPQRSLADRVAARLPGGYDQMLGRRFEDGVELSGGEWQKVALARAYMRDAQVLILDEPTAALDARAEYEVFLRFSELDGGADGGAHLAPVLARCGWRTGSWCCGAGEWSSRARTRRWWRRAGCTRSCFTLQAAGYR